MISQDLQFAAIFTAVSCAISCSLYFIFTGGAAATWRKARTEAGNLLIAIRAVTP